MEMRGQCHRHPPLCVYLSFLWSFCMCCLIYTVCSQDYWRENWGRDLIIRYLFFIFTSLTYGKNQHVRQGIVWSKNLKDVLGPKMKRAWGKVGEVVSGLRLVTRPRNLLPKAAYKIRKAKVKILSLSPISSVKSECNGCSVMSNSLWLHRV